MDFADASSSGQTHQVRHRAPRTQRQRHRSTAGIIRMLTTGISSARYNAAETHALPAFLLATDNISFQPQLVVVRRVVDVLDRHHPDPEQQPQRRGDDVTTGG